MRQIWAATYLSIFLLVGSANAADQAPKEEVKDKAEVLADKASAKGSKALPTPTEKFSKPRAQSVVRLAKNPWTMRSPVLPAPSTGRPVARMMPRWKPSPMSL